jgi:hypothetical protein
VKACWATRMLVVLLAAAAPGCILGNRPSMSRTGSRTDSITYYLDGAGNIGFGKDAVRLGLAEGGYNGRVEYYIWTTYLGPVLDQVSYRHNRKEGRQLARVIEKYLNAHPGAQVNLVGLSAGSGIAVFALEQLKPGYQVDDVVALSSSLSATYDLSRALRRVRGGIHFFWSPDDVILRRVMPLAGTVDRAPHGAPVAGLTGARLPSGAGAEKRELYAKVHNYEWRQEDNESLIKLRHAGSASRSIFRNRVAPLLVQDLPEHRHHETPQTSPAEPEQPAAPPEPRG